MIRRACAVFLLCLSSLAVAAASQMKFKHITVFGDSLSDNGNLYSYSFHVVPKSPPYFKGRFSNGPVWSELLATQYFGDRESTFGDYAVGGAGAVLSTKAVLPYTLWTEISDYLLRQESEQVADTLFFVWIGANNYLNAPTNIDEMTTKVVDATESGIERLIDHGAKMLVLANLPDIGVTPKSRQDGTDDITHQLSLEHNRKLYELYQKLQQQHPDVRFVYFDANKLFIEAMATPEKYHITDVKNSCYTGGYFFRALMANGQVMPTQTVSNTALKQFMQKEASKQGQTFKAEMLDAYVANPVTREAVQNAYFEQKKQRFNALYALSTGVNKEELECDGYLFWDGVHPSRVIHKYIAQFMREAIEAKGIKAVA